MRSAATVRWLRGLGLALLLLAGTGLPASWPAPIAWAQQPARSATDEQLAAFASGLELREIWPFVEAVQSLRKTGRLPPRYVTKADARDRGWQFGGLCTLWPGRVIGGDVFKNLGNPLPGKPGRRYSEADLDSTCEGRGAKRLVFSNDGLIYVTVDHYTSFTSVP